MLKLEKNIERRIFMNDTHICRWCGSTEYDDTCEDGFWCADCDGFTYWDEQSDKRRLLLMLEDKHGQPSRSIIPKTKLRKRLSPLRYPGGKSKVIDQIYSYLNYEQLDTFVELFAGGASLGLSLLDAGIIQKLVLNDLDHNVANFWQVIVEKPDRLCSLIKRTTPTMEDYVQAKKTLSDTPVILNSCSVTFAFFFLLVNRLSYGGIATANPICGKNGSDEALLQRWNPDALIDRIQRIKSMRSQITVRNEDAISLLLNEVGWYPEKTTVFIDPPYVKAGRLLYKKTFEGQHEDLADGVLSFYRSWPGPDLILTYDDCAYIRDLYPEATVVRLESSWSISRG